jgi:hypothetical protein
MSKKPLVQQAIEEFFLRKPIYDPVTHLDSGYVLPTYEELEEYIKTSNANGLVKKRARELLPELLSKTIIECDKQDMALMHSKGLSHDSKFSSSKQQRGNPET